MAEHPTLWGRFMARAHGEVPADTLEAYRRAGLAVYELQQRVEEQRLALKVQGIPPGKVDPATQAQFLCAWNAFALQTLGDAFLDADYRADPSTVGYVPPVTAEQVQLFYAQVEEWVSRAQQAASNPAYRLDVHVPADLPAWIQAEPCPVVHLEAILAATKTLQTHAEAAMAVYEGAGVTPEAARAGQRLRQLLAAASAEADYAQRLGGGPVSPALHEQIERHAKTAVEGFYHLGQALAMPELAATSPHSVPSAGSAPTGLPGPGEPGFDPWCLTDPRARDQMKRDRRAGAAINQIWQYDADSRRTLAIQAEIDAALARGDIAYAESRQGQPLGHYFCCPWSAIYSVTRPVTIAGRRLRTLDQFAYDVSAEGVLKGEPFRREILVARFAPTNDIDYCDPRERGHDD